MTADNGQLKDSQNLSSTQQIYTDPSSDCTSVLDATIYGDLTTLKALVTSGQSVNARDVNGKTPLAVACYQGWYEGVVYLLANGCDQMIADNRQRIPLHAATYNDKIRCLALLVQHLQPKSLNTCDSERMTALHWAAYHDRPEHVQLLISKNINLLAADCDGKTALHWASQKGNDQCVEILMREARGTNLVNMRDKSGKGALHYAAAAGHSRVLSSLTNSKICDIHLQDHYDRQPLHWAAALGRPECVNLLLELGADPNMHDINTRNALYYAKKSSHEECISILNGEMKHLYLEKKEKLKLEERSKHRISSPIRHRQVAPATTDNITSESNSNSKQSFKVSSQSPQDSAASPENTDEMNSSGQKLPPIRGSITGISKPFGTKTNNAEITAITEDSSHSKEKIKQEKKDEPQFFVRNEKPANSAMKFIPMTRLYHNSSNTQA